VQTGQQQYFYNMVHNNNNNKNTLRRLAIEINRYDNIMTYNGNEIQGILYTITWLLELDYSDHSNARRFPCATITMIINKKQ